MSKTKERKWDNWVSIGGLFKEGGQGRLYLVKDSSKDSKEIYVLKELKNPKRLDRFEREIKAITKIRPHPNVIKLIDSGIYRDKNKPCYVMQLADSSLDKYVSELKNNINLSFKIFELICAGVAHLHKAGIIHRDLKPENILMFHETPKISDFGLCLVIDETRFTPTSEAVGSRLYMAPELEDGKNLNVGPSADVYSLGKILYYILSGGIIFSREQYNQNNYRLSKIFNDLRFDIFSKIFKRSITLNIHERCTNALELKHEFKNVTIKFNSHPRTTVFLKLGSSKTIIKEAYDLSTLDLVTNEELKELINFYRSKELTPRIGFFEYTIDKISEKDTDNLIFLLLENETQLGIENLIRISGKILLLKNPKEIHFSMMHHDIIERFLLFALENDDPKIFDSIARINIFILQYHENVITKLSKHFYNFSPDSKQNFLAASYQIKYEGKLELMNNLLENNELDDISFEAVIAGICSMNDQPTLDRIATLGDKLKKRDQIGSFGRGIILGSHGGTLNFFSNYNWKNPMFKILFKALNKNDDNDKGNLTK